MRFQNLTGLKFGRLTVISQAENRRRSTVWLCVCDCGTSKEIRAPQLKNGETQSCGCRHRELVTIHGCHNHELYATWMKMRARCERQNDRQFSNYGGRGIKICQRWSDFDTFVRDMGPRPVGMEVDRRDNDGDYTPENFRWATRTTQQRNTRKNRLLTVRGETRCLAAWSDIADINSGTIGERLRLGWSAEDAVFKPVRKAIPG